MTLLKKDMKINVAMRDKLDTIEASRAATIRAIVELYLGDVLVVLPDAAPTDEVTINFAPEEDSWRLAVKKARAEKVSMRKVIETGIELLAAS